MRAAGVVAKENMSNKMRKTRRGYLIVCMMACSIAMNVLADIPTPLDAIAAEGIQKSLQSPVFLSFWLLWGGLIVIPMSLFFRRNLLKMVLACIGISMLTIGIVTGVKNYDYCGRCGTKLERWYNMGHHAACPKCSPEVLDWRLSDNPLDAREAVRQSSGRKFQD